MKQSSRPCVILSDYPIKTMAYLRFLNGLGEESIHAFRSLSYDCFKETDLVKLVVCDMNVMVEFEAETLARLEDHFPNANILFLEEDHSDMRVRFSGQRDICRLGKLAEISVIQSTVKELLLQCERKSTWLPGHKTEQATQT